MKRRLTMKQPLKEIEIEADDIEILFQQHYSKIDDSLGNKLNNKEYNPKYKQSNEWFSLLYVIVLMSCYYKLNELPLNSFDDFVGHVNLFTVVWQVWFVQVLLASWIHFRNDEFIHTLCHFIQLCYLTVFSISCTELFTNPTAYIVFTSGFIISKSCSFLQFSYVFYNKMTRVILFYLCVLFFIVIIWGLTLAPSMQTFDVDDRRTSSFIWLWRFGTMVDFFAIFFVAAINMHNTINISYLCDRFSELVMALLSLIFLISEKQTNLQGVLLYAVLIFTIWYNYIYCCTYKDTNQVLWLIAHYLLHVSIYFSYNYISTNSFIIIPVLMGVLICTSVTIRDKWQLLLRGIFTLLTLIYLAVPSLVVMDTLMVGLILIEFVIN